MIKNLLLATTILALSFGLTACQQRATDLAPGTYEKSTSATDANGTTTTTDKSTEVIEDASGNKTAVVKSKTTKDPKGLFNKSTTQQTTVIQENH